MPSHSLAKLKIEDLEIIGYSVSGEETCIAMPNLDVCFDIGKAPDQVIPINHVLLSHGHMDHTAGIAYYLSHRLFAGQQQGTVLAAKELISPLQNLIDCWINLDKNKINAKLVPMKPGSEYAVKPNLYARAFPTDHCKGSLGYCILEKRKKLKPQLTSMSSQQLVQMKKSGKEIDYTIELPIVSYLGDTRLADYHKIDYVSNSKILITECTFFLNDHLNRADAGSHLHIDDFAKLIDRMNNQYIIVTHLTKRTGIKQIKKLFLDKLGSENMKKIYLLMDQRRRY